QIDDPLGTRGYVPDMRGGFGETSLTMDPFGAAFEASVTPLDASDLFRRPDDITEAPAEADRDGSVEASADAVAETTTETTTGWLDTGAADETDETDET